jgi:hypothetical protein
VKPLARRKILAPFPLAGPALATAIVKAQVGNATDCEGDDYSMFRAVPVRPRRHQALPDRPHPARARHHLHRLNVIRSLHPHGRTH